MENGKYFQKEMIMLVLVPRVLMQFADGEQTLEYIPRYWNDEIKVCIHLYSSYCQLSTGLVEMILVAVCSQELVQKTSFPENW